MEEIPKRHEIEVHEEINHDTIAKLLQKGDVVRLLDKEVDVTAEIEVVDGEFKGFIVIKTTTHRRYDYDTMDSFNSSSDTSKSYILLEVERILHEMTENKPELTAELSSEHSGCIEYAFRYDLS